MVSNCATFTIEYCRVIAYYRVCIFSSGWKHSDEGLQGFSAFIYELWTWSERKKHVGKHEWLYCKSFFVLYVKAADVRRRESLNVTTLNGYCRKMHCFLKTTVCFGKSWCYPLKCEVLKQLKQFTSQTFKSDLWVIKFLLSWIMPA